MAATATANLGVYADRLDRAQQELGRQGQDLLLVGPSSDFFYLTGHNAHASERMTLLAVPRRGKPFAVVPSFEATLMADRREIIDLHAWPETQEPAEVAAAKIGEASGKTIAAGQQLWATFLLRLQDALPGARWVDATPTLRELRMVKDQREIALMHEAGRRTDEAWHAFIKEPLSGKTEQQALKRLQELTEARGLVVEWGLCASGPNSASPHHQSSERMIQQGDAVVFDWGGNIEGYNSDVTRTVHVGEPSEEFRTVYEIVGRANQATLDAVRPGVACQELDRVARELISDAGYGDAFLHRVGHGLGLDVHEEPYLVDGNDLPLAEGMVFSDEPGIYLEGRFGVRTEDAVVCTADSGMRLNEATRELIIIG